MNRLELEATMTKIDSPSIEPFPLIERVQRPWCLFQSGAATYAVSLEFVAEVVEVERLVRVPHSPPRIVGLCTLRREVIPVVNLGELQESEAGPIFAAKTMVLLLRTTRGYWAVQINAEGIVVTDEIMPTASPAETTEDRPGHCRTGTLTRASTSYTVIDPEATWREVRESIATWYDDHYHLSN